MNRLIEWKTGKLIDFIPGLIAAEEADSDEFMVYSFYDGVFLNEIGPFGVGHRFRHIEIDLGAGTLQEWVFDGEHWDTGESVKIELKAQEVFGE